MPLVVAKAPQVLSGKVCLGLLLSFCLTEESQNQGVLLGTKLYQPMGLCDAGDCFFDFLCGHTQFFYLLLGCFNLLILLQSSPKTIFVHE